MPLCVLGPFQRLIVPAVDESPVHWIQKWMSGKVWGELLKYVRVLQQVVADFVSIDDLKIEVGDMTNHG